MNTVQKFIYSIIRTFFLILGRIPRPMARSLAAVVGRIWFAFDAGHRKIALENLTQSFEHEKSPQDIRLIARRTFENIAFMPFEIGWSLVLNERRYSRYFKIYGMQNLFHARMNHKGVFILTAHIGNWELFPILGKIAGFPISVIYRPLDLLPLNTFIENIRTRFGATLIPKAHSMGRIYEAQQKGYSILNMMDQSSDWYGGVITYFFNHRAFTSKGLALLALKTHAPVVPVFIARQGDEYLVEIQESLTFVQTGDKTRDIEENTQIYTTCIESFIRRFPDQWFWIHRRWKNKSYRPWPRIE